MNVEQDTFLQSETLTTERLFFRTYIFALYSVMFTSTIQSTLAAEI
jgi:hypothetical protein